jgi:hypothetical protein
LEKSGAPSAAFLIDGGHAQLLKSMRGGLAFSDEKPECFMRHETFAFFNDVETLCFRNGAIAPE